MSLELKSQELKDVVSKYDTQWFLGHLSFLMQNITNDIGKSMIENLSSPMRQLYFLGGLLMSSNVSGENKNQCSDEEWDDIVQKLNEIELEYTMMFFPKEDEEITEHWKKAREIAMPSFLSYFNLGPLNYEEQIIDRVQKLYSQLDNIIESETGLTTQDFIQFYENVDKLHQSNFQSFTKKETVRPDWKKYTKLEIGHSDDMPEEMQEMFDERLPLVTFVADYGIICRFLPEDITSDNLSLEKVNKILQLLSGQRTQSDFLYYTSTKPGNPLTEKPIADIGEGMYQVFEVKQIMHSIDNLLESVCSKIQSNTSKLVEKKGKLLENKIVELFKAYFKDDCEVFQGYYVDGCEQDILILWKDYAFIIEAKGYNIREPFRDPDKAYVRIKDDFNACIGYAYTQTKRVEEKFLKKESLRITDKDGNLIKEIDTAKYEDNDFSIIVNLNSFGAIQTDLSFLLKIDEDAAYPWAVRFDDLEIFILTLIAQKKSPYFLINYLLMREKLHGKLICADESEVCGGYISNKISEKLIESNDTILTHHSLADIFDNQYFKGMGFKNEKYLNEKKSEKYKIFGTK